MTQKLTQVDIEVAARTLGVDAASIKAVMAVEAAGSGFLDDGRVKVQYEPHVMYRQLKKKFGQARADAELARHPDLVSLKAGGYQALDKEDKDMNRAAQEIDRQCALESASWGLPQIMGYHWETCNYPSIQGFLNDMYRSEGGQLNVFVKFIAADSRLINALRSKDWAEFARVYNGPNYAANKYDTKLAAEYARALKA